MFYTISVMMLVTIRPYFSTISINILHNDYDNDQIINDYDNDQIIIVWLIIR